jgi:hypothetical protein
LTATKAKKYIRSENEVSGLILYKCGRNEKCIMELVSDNLKERDCLEDVGIDENES